MGGWGEACSKQPIIRNKNMNNLKNLRKGRCIICTGFIPLSTKSRVYCGKKCTKLGIEINRKKKWNYLNYYKNIFILKENTIKLVKNGLDFFIKEWTLCHNT